MSYNLMGIALAGKFLSILFFSLSLVFYKASPKLEKEDTQTDAVTKETKANGDSGIGRSWETSTSSRTNGTTQSDVNKNDPGKTHTTKL